MPDKVESETSVVSPRKSESEDTGEHDPYYEPIISLPLVKISTNEEEEVEMCKIRAKLYRFDKVDHEWKERGTGDIKLLHHNENNTVRVVMRRDKTLKLCANHFITEDIQLQPHIGSDRCFNWTTFGDYADETMKQEFLAIKFGNIENATLWKTKFEEALDIVRSKNNLNNSKTISENSNSEDTSSLSTLESNSEPNVNVTSEKDLGDDNQEDKKRNENEVVLKLEELKIEHKDENVKNE